MFLVGGPSYSGTTFLAHLLNQGKIFCWDEPDFDKPNQIHRGIPFLKSVFPDKNLPSQPERPLVYEESLKFIKNCEALLSPFRIGIKACNEDFVGYAEICRKMKYPVICIIRDIRDALSSQLPCWDSEKNINERYRLIWSNIKSCDYYFRYEDLVTKTALIIEKISYFLAFSLKVPERWDPQSIHPIMFKLKRHNRLKDGVICKNRVGIWRTCGKNFSDETHRTAKMMGY